MRIFVLGLVIALMAIIIGGCAESSGQAALKPTPDAYFRGKEVFMKHCQMCHGKRADGRGPLSAELPPPKPRDFRDPEVAATSADSLRRTIVKGGAATGLNPKMPAWGEVLSSQEVDDVLTFIRTVSHVGHIPDDDSVHALPLFAN